MSVLYSWKIPKFRVLLFAIVVLPLLHVLKPKWFRRLSRLIRNKITSLIKVSINASFTIWNPFCNLVKYQIAFRFHIKIKLFTHHVWCQIGAYNIKRSFPISLRFLSSFSIIYYHCSSKADFFFSIFYWGYCDCDIYFVYVQQLYANNNIYFEILSYPK